MVRADFQNFVREYGAKMSIADFYEVFWRRLEDRKLDVVRSAEIALLSHSWRTCAASSEERSVLWTKGSGPRAL